MSRTVRGDPCATMLGGSYCATPSRARQSLRPLHGHVRTVGEVHARRAQGACLDRPCALVPSRHIACVPPRACGTLVITITCQKDWKDSSRVSSFMRVMGGCPVWKARDRCG
eukprot:5266530-Prymnesium_polylepis.1